MSEVHSMVMISKETLMHFLLRCQSPFSSVTIIGFDVVEDEKVVFLYSKTVDQVLRVLAELPNEFGYTVDDGKYFFIEEGL